MFSSSTNGARLMTLLAVLVAIELPMSVAMAVQPVPHVMDWMTDPQNGTVHFQVHWVNPDSSQNTVPVAGVMSSQLFGVYQQNAGTIGTFEIPPMAPDSFFDVEYDISLADLPPTAEERLPGGGPLREDCPPDDHWDGNVDVIWDGPEGQGQVNAHYGTILVCPGAGNSYIHVSSVICSSPNGVLWQIVDLCPDFAANLVNEDFTPAPAVLPDGWSGWICIAAAAGTPSGVECCPRVLFECGTEPAEIRLCATTCDWSQTPPNPVPRVLDWVTDPVAGTVHFQVHWTNPDSSQNSVPVSGVMSSQLFGVYQDNMGVIGTFDVPSLNVDSFFDVEYDISLADLPPSAEERLPGGGPLREDCPPDDHWDGNVDVVWDGPGGPGEVNAHYGTILVCPGAGNSYIHVSSLICGSPNGVTWQIVDLCANFAATLVNEDFTAAPAVLPDGWSGWICIAAAAGTPSGEVCCPRLLFDCGGEPAEIRLCATTCDWSQSPPNPVPHVLDWVTDPVNRTVHFQVHWVNPDTSQTSLPVSGVMSSQLFGVYQENMGTIGTFDIPPMAPDSFFDIAYDVSWDDLPPTAEERLPGGGPLREDCPPDDHWDGNVDVVWDGQGGPGQVNVHYGTILVNPGAGNSYIHVSSLICSDPNGVTWQVVDLCQNFAATLVNEDFTAAPAVLPDGWSGWICIAAAAGTPSGEVCCPRVLFNCGGEPAAIRLCAMTCDWLPADVPTDLPTAGFALRITPNPILRSATLHYVVPLAAETRLEIFDASGKLVRMLWSAPIQAGAGSLVWDGQNDHGDTVPSGVYFVRLTQGKAVTKQKVMLMR